MIDLKYIKTFEAFGTNNSVEKWSIFIMNIIKKNITPFFLDNEESSFIIKVKNYKADIEKIFTKNDFYDFPIQNIELNFDMYTYQEKNKCIGANFSSVNFNNSKLLKFDFFGVNSPYLTLENMKIVLSIYVTEKTWEEKYNTITFWEDFPDFTSVIQHEVHHAFEEFIMNSKGKNPQKNKDAILDDIIRKVWKDYPKFQEITKFIYLSTTHEISARITQLDNILKRNNVKTKKDFYNTLYNSIIWKDYKILADYDPIKKTDDFYNKFTDKEVELFLSLWNNNVYDKYPKFDSIEKFFNYWKPIIEYKSKKMKKKIFRTWNLLIKKEDL